jgi:hypothetical protein
VDIDTRIAQTEKVTGKHLIVRAITTPEPEFRAWVEVRPSAVVIEYVEELPGYFWGFELLERLLEWVEAGGGSAWFYQQDDRLIRIPASRHSSENAEGSSQSP